MAVESIQEEAKHQTENQEAHSQDRPDPTPTEGDDEEAAHYYWDDTDGAESTDMLTKSSHWAYWIGSKTLEGMEFTGEIVANVLGLTRSKYQWILDIKEREEEEKRIRELENRQRRQLALEKLLEEEKGKLQALETGLQHETV